MFKTVGKRPKRQERPKGPKRQGGSFFLRRFGRFLATLAVLALALSLALHSLSLPLPSAEKPLCIYSTNLQRLFASAVKEAKTSLYLSMYAVTDPYLCRLLKQQSEKIPTTILHDKKATPTLELGACGYARPVALGGALMHRKIVVVDGEETFLGSANLTTPSLKAHDNLVVGLWHPGLAAFLKNCSAPSYLFTLGKVEGEAWLLPDVTGQALEKILSLLRQSKKSLYVAMFTLTHPKLIEALIGAHARGVDVRVAVDFFTAEGASLKALERLHEAGIPLFASRGHQLFHHKWALIDKSTLILGSANWTKAAFTHNEDCFMILRKLPFKQKKLMKKIWKIIELETIKKDK